MKKKETNFPCVQATASAVGEAVARWFGMLRTVYYRMEACLASSIVLELFYPTTLYPAFLPDHGKFFLPNEI